eukprot:4774584-Lingulodinium_polyedra.AAC.1
MPRMSSVLRMGTPAKSTQEMVAPGAGSEMRGPTEVILSPGQWQGVAGLQVVSAVALRDGVHGAP